MLFGMVVFIMPFCITLSFRKLRTTWANRFRLLCAIDLIYFQWSWIMFMWAFVLRNQWKSVPSCWMKSKLGNRCIVCSWPSGVEGIETLYGAESACNNIFSKYFPLKSIETNFDSFFGSSITIIRSLRTHCKCNIFDLSIIKCNSVAQRPNPIEVSPSQNTQARSFPHKLRETHDELNSPSATGGVCNSCSYIIWSESAIWLRRLETTTRTTRLKFADGKWFSFKSLNENSFQRAAQ